jgi:hypothetical protein
MTDKQIQTKLNQIVKLCNELDTEAKRRYGAEAMLFFEADGDFHIMDGDEDPANNKADRQAHIRFSAKGYCSMGAGAW